MDGPHFADGQPALSAERLARKLKPLADFLAEQQPLDFAISPIAQSGCVYTLTAPTGSGKTAWAILAALAVATGRGDIIGCPVKQGRAIFLAVENADGTRTRLLSACAYFSIDRAISESLLVHEGDITPETAREYLEVASFYQPIRLVIVDTLAAAFKGDSENSAVQTGKFIRDWRPITKVSGRPAIIVAAHPVKDAARGDLKPYGSGAILNEVDGNLTLWKDTGGMVELKAHGKFRGAPFDPIRYEFVSSTSRAVLDVNNVPVPLTVLRAFGSKNHDEHTGSCSQITPTIDSADQLLLIIQRGPFTIRQIAKELHISNSTALKRLVRAEEAGLVAKDAAERRCLTGAGRQRIADLS